MLAAFTSDSEQEAEICWQDAECGVKELQDRNSVLQDLDSQMLVEQLAKYQKDANKWESAKHMAIIDQDLRSIVVADFCPDTWRSLGSLQHRLRQQDHQ